jgi:hypothetical protein
MGRPPIGKQAMSATERQRRWRAKKRASKPIIQPAAAAARVGRRELEADPTALWTMAQRLADSLLVFVARVHELEIELACVRAEQEAPPDAASLPKTYRKRYEVARRGLERRFKDRVRQEAYSLLLFLPDLRQRLEQAERQNRRDKGHDGRKPLVPLMTGYQPAADLILGPAARAKAQATTSASTKTKRATARAARKRARAAT